MSENTFQTRVKNYIEMNGGYALNIPGGTQIPKGTPDLIVCWRGRFLGLELKTKTGRLAELQAEKIANIRDAGGYARRLGENEWETFKQNLRDMRPYDTV